MNTNVFDVQYFIQHTLWVVQRSSYFVALNNLGDEIARNKYRSTLGYILRERIQRRELDCYAIANVIPPSRRLKRGPNKPKRR